VNICRYFPLSAVCLGCAPKIQNFTVDPQVVCGQQAVWAYWRARGGAALRTTVEKSSKRPDAPTVETYTLVVVGDDRTPTEADVACDLASLAAGQPAPCGKSVVQRRQVQRFRDSASVQLGARAVLKADSLVIEVALGREFVASNFRITGITSSPILPFAPRAENEPDLRAADARESIL
jgi:hypothetical protein